VSSYQHPKDATRPKKKKRNLGVNPDVLNLEVSRTGSDSLDEPANPITETDQVLGVDLGRTDKLLTI
jgi:hypothetical protein